MFGLLLRPSFFTLISLSLLINVGCASFFGQSPTAERYMACPLDSVWSGALEALAHYPVTVQDKEKGLIETDWRVQAVQGRPYGLFGREGLGDKERSRLTITLKSLNQGVVLVKLNERRQHWGFRGGQQLYTWYPVESSQESLNRIMGTMTTKLEEEGCLFES